MVREIQVLVRVRDPAHLDAAVDALTDRGMRVFWRRRGASGGKVWGTVAPALFDALRLVGGCDVVRT